MMTIQKRQLDAIGARLARRWEDTMVLHLETFFPELSAELGPQGVLHAIEIGQKKAARYDIHSERDVCKFLNFMFAFGMDFDIDPELPWAHAILTNEGLVRANVKLHLLEQAANGELDSSAMLLPEPPDEAMEAALLALTRGNGGESSDLITTGDDDGTTGE